MLKLKPQYSGQLVQRTDSLEKTLRRKRQKEEKRGKRRKEEKAAAEDEMVGWHH